MEVIGASYPQGDFKHVPTIIDGIKCRIARELPKIDNNVFGEFRDFVGKWLASNVVPLPFDTDYSFDNWIEKTNYTRSRKRELTNVNEAIITGTESTRRVFRCKCFVKDEGYKTFKPVRCIYSRTDTFKVIVGPVFKQIENLLFENGHFIKKVPVCDRPSYIENRFCGFVDSGCHILGTDYTAFESHFTPKLMKEIEFQLYEHSLKFYRDKDRFINYIKRALLGVNHCSFKDLTARVRSKRMSGEMNTSLGNGFVNLMVFKFLNYKYGNESDCLVEGDDLLGCIKGRKLVDADYASLGFNVKCEYFKRLGDASFCGQLYCENLRVITDVHKVLLNFGWTNKQYMNSNVKVYKSLLKSKALSILHLNPGCPIISVLAMRVYNLFKSFKTRIPVGLDNYSRNRLECMVNKDIPDQTIMHSTRNLVAKFFNYDIESQIELEDYFKKINYDQIFSLTILDHCNNDQLNYDRSYVFDYNGIYADFNIDGLIMKNKKKAKKIAVKKQLNKIVKNKATKQRKNNVMPGLAKTIAGTVGQVIGAGLGGAPGSAIGSKLGEAAGSLFSRITGFGDYKVSSNSLLYSNQDPLPSFQGIGRGMRVVHREYLADVFSGPSLVSSASIFNGVLYPIQPGLSTSFPWLNQIANNFTEYKINGMIFEFKSNSYDAISSTNTASGTVIMTTQYNVLLAPFTSKQAMEQYEFTCSEKPSVNIIHPIECARAETIDNVLCVRDGAESGDLRLYDFGNFTIATVGMQAANVNLGELWVSYDITLLKPALGPSIGVADHYYLGPLASVNPKSGGNAFGTNPILTSASNMGTVLNNSSVITIPNTFQGYLAVGYHLQLVNTLVNPTIFSTVNGNVSVLNLVDSGPYTSTALTYIYPNTSVGTVGEVCLTAFFVSTGGGQITLIGPDISSLGSPAIKAGDLYIMSIPLKV